MTWYQNMKTVIRKLLEEIRRLKLWQLASNCASLGFRINEKSLARLDAEYQELCRQVEDQING